jgi:hypothetical protein
MTNYPQSRKANIVVQDLDSEVLIYDLKINKAYCLNQTSALVFQLCNGKNSLPEICEQMSFRLKTFVSEDIVQLALEELKKENLLENADELPNHFAGLARRDIIKKIGLASMVALPIVSSIVAPVSVNAQSCIPFNAACTPGPSNGGCCPMSTCAGILNICGCMCVTPGDCLSQTSCPSTVNCNGNGICSP